MNALPEIRIDPVPAAPPAVAGAEPLASLLHLFAAHRRGASDPAATIIPALVAEGRRFATTDSGRRWISLLAESELVANGWVLWNLLDLDRHVTDRDLGAFGDTPSAMLEQILRSVAEADAQTLTAALDAVAAAMAEQDD